MAQKVTLPKYTLSEELISAISHGFGVILAVIGLIFGLYYAIDANDTLKIVAMIVYGFTLIVLFTISTLYHSLKPNKGKKVLRVLDHCSIYLLISGTYTPFALVSLKGGVGTTILIVSWAACILGITLNAIDIKKFAIFSMISYIAMGWMIVITFIPLTKAVATSGIILLVLGGVAYTLGTILYGLGKKIKYAHSIWHFFVLVGAILHYFSILFYVIKK